MPSHPLSSSSDFDELLPGQAERMLTAAAIGFFFGFVGSMPVAGPIAALVFARGVEGRFKAGLGIAAGCAVAESLYAGLAFWGFAALLARFEILVPISRGVAAVVLIILGIMFLRQQEPQQDAPQRSEDWGGSIALGFVITALNPTLIATWSAVATGVLSSELVELDKLAAIPFGAAAGVGIFAWFALMLYLLKRLRGRFSDRALGRVLQAMGIFLLGVAAWFVFLLVRSLVGAES